MKIIKDKSFYKSLVAIALPIALQNLVSFATGMLDTIMLGLAPDSENMLSASALANQPIFILYVFGFGISGGASVLIAQYWGKGDREAIKRIMAMALKIAAVLSMIFGIVILSFPQTVISLYTADPTVRRLGAEYLSIMGWACFTFGISTTMICMLRAIEVVKISVWINIVSFMLNISLNWVLIFGNLGFPAMGIRGAAIATLIARLSEFVIITLYVFLFEKKLRFVPKDLRLYDRILMKDLLRYGTPVMLNEGLWALGSSVQASIMGHIEYSEGDPVAANSIAQMLQQLAYLVVFGIANAAAVLTGKAIGEDDRERTLRQADTFKIIGLGVGVFAFTLIMLLRKVAVSFYQVSDATKQLAEQMILVIAVITFFVALIGVLLMGILRGSGDTKFCLFLEIGTLWLLGVPLAFLSASILHLPVPIVLLLMKIDEPTKAVISMLRVRSGKWLRRVTRDF